MHVLGRLWNLSTIEVIDVQRTRIFKILTRVTVSTNGNLVIQVQHGFSFKQKKTDDAASGPETNHQVLASFLISFSWKKMKF